MGNILVSHSCYGSRLSVLITVTHNVLLILKGLFFSTSVSVFEGFTDCLSTWKSARQIYCSLYLHSQLCVQEK